MLIQESLGKCTKADRAMMHWPIRSLGQTLYISAGGAHHFCPRFEKKNKKRPYPVSYFRLFGIITNSYIKGNGSNTPGEGGGKSSCPSTHNLCMQISSLDGNLINHISWHYRSGEQNPPWGRDVKESLIYFLL